VSSAMSIAPRGPVDVLLVEDDDGDAYLTEYALRRGPVSFVLHRVETGEEALDFLRARGDHDGAASPHLVLLDLNLPGISGRDVLREIKGDPDLRRIPVVVLTSSKQENDILRSLNLHANTYMVKPGDPRVFEGMASIIQSYWFEHAVLSSS